MRLNKVTASALWEVEMFTDVVYVIMCAVGMNSIVVYVGHEMFHAFPVQFYVPPTHAYLLAMHIWGCVVWTVVAWLMYRQKFFISL